MLTRHRQTDGGTGLLLYTTQNSVCRGVNYYLFHKLANEYNPINVLIVGFKTLFNNI